MLKNKPIKLIFSNWRYVTPSLINNFSLRVFIQTPAIKATDAKVRNPYSAPFRYSDNNLSFKFLIIIISIIEVNNTLIKDLN